MTARRRLTASLVLLSLLVPAAACAQGAPAPGRAPTEQEIRERLVFNSPWESRSTVPGQVYRYRTTFIMRGDDLVAQVLRYATNEQGDSVVTVKEGRVVWQDTSGADVAVALEGDDLVGTAVSKSAKFAVVFKARP